MQCPGERAGAEERGVAGERAGAEEEDVIVGELLVEVVSIDGMCGVY
jgi:mycofactocin precursor